MSKTTTASAPQGAQTVVYFYGLRGHLLAETSGTGTPIRTYAWRNDTPVAQIEHTANGDKILYFDPDHLNTPRAAMDETGKVVWRWESDAFGTTTPDEDPDGDGVKTTLNLRFGGYYADVESGLFYAKHRYYSPLLTIFTQVDRLDLLRRSVNPLYAGYSEQTDLQRALNQPFTYAGNNPLSYVDPLGLCRRGYKQAEGQAPGVCEPDNRVEPDKCPIGECAAERPPPPYKPELEQCQDRCAVAAANPFSSDFSDHLGKMEFGAAFKALMKIFNKAQSAFDYGKCMQDCKKKYPGCGGK